MSLEYKGIIINSNNIVKNLKMYEYTNYYKLSNLKFVPSVADKDTVGHSSFPIIYTDGSKMEKGVSAAFTVCYRVTFIYDYRINMHQLNTIFQAELTAIFYAIKWFIDSNFLLS